MPSAKDVRAATANKKSGVALQQELGWQVADNSAGGYGFSRFAIGCIFQRLIERPHNSMNLTIRSGVLINGFREGIRESEPGGWPRQIPWPRKPALEEQSA